MRQIFGVVCIVLLTFLISGCENPETVQVQKEAKRVQRLQSNANEVVDNIQYIKDLRTGLCFAYYWGGMANGGPALATVSCEAVPAHLLTIAK